jgi:hypothetical protein
MRFLKRLPLTFALGLVLGGLVSAPLATLAIGETAASMHAKSPLRYVKCQMVLSAQTAGVTASHLCGIVAPGVIKDVQAFQQIAGDGTSWTINVLKNGTTVLATNGVLASATGANKAISVAKSPLRGGFPAKGSGDTLPVLSATTSAYTVAAGDTLTVTTTVNGTYNSGFTGSIWVLIEPSF